MTVDHVIELEQAKYMFKFTNKLLPTRLNLFLTRGSEIHRYGTRFNYEPERIKSNFAPLGSSFLSKAPITWNKIKTKFKDIKHIGGFASKVKKEMIDSYK